jgi:hypothetical protein
VQRFTTALESTLGLAPVRPLGVTTT